MLVGAGGRVQVGLGGERPGRDSSRAGDCKAQQVLGQWVRDGAAGHALSSHLEPAAGSRARSRPDCGQMKLVTWGVVGAQERCSLFLLFPHFFFFFFPFPVWALGHIDTAPFPLL